MRSVRAAIIATLVLTVGAALAGLITTKTVATFQTTGQLSLSERVLLAASNWYVRLLPMLTLAVVGGAALFAGRTAPSTTALRQERNAWAAFALVSLASSFGALAVLQFGGGPWWGLGFSVTSASFVVACCGIILVLVRIHRHQRYEVA